MDKLERWIDVYHITCIKKYKTLSVGHQYKVEGRGDLEFVFAPEVEGRKGWGVNIIHYDWLKEKPLETIKRIYYLDLNELEEYFCTDDEDMKVCMRDAKLKSIGI